MTYLHSLLKRIPALIIMVALSVSFLLVSAAPQQAQAQWAVGDFMSYIKMAISHGTQILQKWAEFKLEYKELIQDPAAWISAKGNLNTATSKIINMVSGGYVDPYDSKLTGPMFVTNLLQNLRDNVGTPVAHTVITNVGQGSSPFANAAAFRIRRNYYNNSSPQGFWTTHKYTLSQTVNNPSQFLQGDFSQGGVNGFLSMVSNPMNNPYGTYFAAQNHLNTKVGAARSARRTELAYGGGFKSSPGMPGSVVKAQLDKGLSSGINTMVVEDEVDESIGSLSRNLVTNSLGKSGGITGFTNPSTGGSSGVSNYTNQKPPLSTLKNIAAGMLTDIGFDKTTLNNYIGNWGIILNPTNKAKNALADLINYTPPVNAYDPSLQTDIYDPAPYAVCLNNFKALQPVASASQASVQSIIADGTTAINNAKKSLDKLDTISKKIKNAVSKGTATAIEQAVNNYQNLTNISNGLMPSGASIAYARTQSTSIPSSQGGGGVHASGIDGLTVTGSTVVNRMFTLFINATAALTKTKTCFANSKSTGLGA